MHKNKFTPHPWEQNKYEKHQSFFYSENICHVFTTIWRVLNIILNARSRSYFTTDSQSVGQSVCLGIEHPCGTCDQILLPVGMLLSEICGLLSIGRPLWREDGSSIYSVITQWSESLRTRNHTLLSHLRLPQPGGPGSRIYIPQEQIGPVIPPGTGFPLRRLLRLASYDKVRGYFTTDSQSVRLGIEHPCGTCDQILLPVGMLLSCLWGALSDERTGMQYAV
jgi:hypothetical protein